MQISKSKSGADNFFISHLTASAAVIILWTGYLNTLPSFVAGLAAGLVLASSALMFLFRTKDEYTLATWHAGTSAAFAASVLFLLADAFTPAFENLSAADFRLGPLAAMTAYLMAVLIKRLRDRA
ncbi:hypothetical protein [Erythrobacter ani]|uniref:Uncharacterized protein n=1 Tax=Erythrobacter ani TaxID=2827235 RepID=A0ABS6SPZ7_9SPHN|nr:hypothetical protein [Erythrobacter ani]MBV7267116.1 hypothetical protein [Erythrobacter ani]